MKRFITVLSSLLVLPAFAEVAPVYYDEIVEYTDEMLDAADEAEEAQAKEVAAPKNVAQRTTINRSTSRAISAAGNQASQRSGASSRAMASSSRATTARTTVSRATARPSNVVSRASVSRNSNVTSRSSRTTTPKAVTARASVTGTAMGALKNNGATAAYIDDTNKTYNSTGSARAASNRRATARMSTGLASVSVAAPVITEEDISTTTSNLTAIAELTDYCKAQYAACMDNYCNVLDDNQGRCSCSKNIKNYERVEQALADATENFQKVVQEIKYIGLSADQINSLFDETIAEQTMNKRRNDSSDLQNSLEKIKKSIVEASSPRSSSYDSGVSMDASGLFNFDTEGGFNINAFLGNNSNTSSVSNQRGEQLYKTATNRCKTAVLNSCVSQGIDANVITNSYDLEIDKQCIAYERSLNDANSEMRQNVANATTILKQARLVLAQSKNTYDVRGCVAAIDSCMQDEYVCGSDYELCLDPTGKYLANGEIVKGGTPGVSGGSVVNTTPIGSPQGDDSEESSSISVDLNGWTSHGMYNLYSVWNYTTTNGPALASSSDQNILNPWGRGKSENLNSYIDSVMTKYWSKSNNYSSTSSTDDIAVYLLRKIGYIDSSDNNKVHGMCASVMKQCQNYTYKSDKYQPDNEVIRQYLAAALTKIKLQQDSILADYAEDCRSDVSSCLSTNGYDETNPQSTASATAVNACRADISTCMSVGGYMPKDNSTLTLRSMSDWVASMLQVCNANEYLNDNNGVISCKKCTTAQVKKLDADGYPTVGAGDAYPSAVPTESEGGQVTSCHCPTGYRGVEYDEDEDGTPTLFCVPVSH